MNLNTLLGAALDGKPLVEEGEYSSVIAICWLTPIKCTACGREREDCQVLFTALQRSSGVRVSIRNHDPASFLAQHPDATRRIGRRDQETVPFCSCIHTDLSEANAPRK